jgi:hypothetical protein
LFYQWGRKDPFPGGKSGTAGWNALSSFEGMPDAGDTDVKTVSSSTVDGAIIESVRNPTRFLSEKTDGDWLPVPKDDLWNFTADDGKYKKTIYDPCPAGWRVPVRINMTGRGLNASPWKGLTTSYWPSGDTGGERFGTNALYPCTGFRVSANGTFIQGGTIGCYWEGTPISGPDQYAIILYIPISYPEVDTESLRASTCSVRCVQEN